MCVCESESEGENSWKITGLSVLKKMYRAQSSGCNRLSFNFFLSVLLLVSFTDWNIFSAGSVLYWLFEFCYCLKFDCLRGFYADNC